MCNVEQCEHTLKVSIWRFRGNNCLADGFFSTWILSLAVAYECTRTITSIYPDKDLIDKAARCVGVFLVAKSNDIKYLGKWLKFFFDMNNTFSIHSDRAMSFEYL